MRARTIIICAVSAFAIVGAMQTAATASITPTNATTSDPIAYGSSPGNVIDGVINYDQWLALGVAGGGAFAGPYTVTFDLGGAYDLTGFNLWNNGGSIPNDGEGVDSFTLTFFDPSSANVGSFNGNANDGLGMQSFGFSASNVQTVDFKINSNHGPTTRAYVIFYEANFDGTPVVPVPGALLLAMSGLAGLVGIRSRV